jgi:hypothetical protein
MQQLILREQLLETINNPSKARKSVLVLKQQLPRNSCCYCSTGDVITVDVTVCIDAKVSVESLLIYQNLNNATPEFLCCL